MMSNYYLFPFFLFLVSSLSAQKASTWSKEQKNVVYNECTSELARSGVSSEQKQEEFCYCFLQKLTNNLTPNDLANLIEPEQKKISENYYKSCSAETGVRFNYSSSSSPYSSNGSWSREQRDYHYKKCKKDLFAKNYKVTLEEQEEFCLCYLDKLTKNHPASEIDNMISPELKKVQSKYFNVCSAETGTSLSTNNVANAVLEIFTGDWDRKKKDYYYNSCENDLKSNGKDYTTGEIEEFCMCYIDRLSSKYSARELDDMISPEFRRVKEEVYNKCTSVTTIGTMTLEDNMVGRWERSTGEVLIFEKGGRLQYIYEENDMEEEWRWRYKPGNILVFVAGGVEIEYKVLYIKHDYIKYKPLKHSSQIYEYYKK
ncbi:hypothetical protein [Aureispira anguillae]|uniref:Uncharacterized protein n=1 Tax=Aureispira anguillae TaxID=2864201 RepID=A0A916DVY4_9BACT|nr:hypothetical protein [Aureispira anguillae]BDS15624.1 hypothetical protein AsAng_0064080 [Aureispira anguillae]